MSRKHSVPLIGHGVLTKYEKVTLLALLKEKHEIFAQDGEPLHIRVPFF